MPLWVTTICRARPWVGVSAMARTLAGVELRRNFENDIFQVWAVQQGMDLRKVIGKIHIDNAAANRNNLTLKSDFSHDALVFSVHDSSGPTVCILKERTPVSTLTQIYGKASGGQA